MGEQANGGSAVRTLSRAFACALVAIAVASCGGADALGPKDIVAVQFVTQPASLTAGTPFSVSVELVASGNRRVTAATDPVTLTIGGGATLAGTTTVAAIAGVATFTGLSVSTAATGVVLTAARGALLTSSTAFNVTAGPPALAASTLTFPGTVGTGTALAATFTIKDALGNSIASAPIALATSIAGTTFTPNSGTTSTTGVFATSINFGAAGAGTVTATVSGVALAFPVSPVAPAVCTIGAATIDTPINGTVSNAAANGCSLNGHAASVYRFSVPPGPNATMVGITATGTGTFFPEVSISPDPTPTTGTITYGNSTSAPTNGPREWLLPSGSYLAKVSSANGNGGSFTLSLTTTSGTASACDAAGENIVSSRFLPNVNATYTGQRLDTTDCPDPSGPYYADFFFIYDSRPCTITMQAAYGVFLEIADINFVLLQPAVDTPNLTGSISLPSCNTSQGSLIIITSSHDVGITGPYTMQVAFTGSAIRSANLLGSGTDWVNATSQILKRSRWRK